MNREEILAKSRAENGADERAAYIGLQGAHFSMGVLIVLWVVLAKTVDLAPVARGAGVAGQRRLFFQLWLSVCAQPDQDRMFLLRGVSGGDAVLFDPVFKDGGSLMRHG